MAFHLACPITCRRVCGCELGFGAAARGEEARAALWAEVAALEGFLADPWLLRPLGAEADTVQVEVPAVEPAADDAEEEARRAAMQRQAAAAEDFVRRLEGGASCNAKQPDQVMQKSPDIHGDEANDSAREDQGYSGVKVMCRLCFSGENEGSIKAAKMLACKLCSKKYHRSCLKNWGEHRDLFHWSSWACPSCRTCEVCRRAGDPNKLMFCKRCDGAYHCYCQQPPHKNVGHGPYLCPKHTRCHSCGSGVPGSGHSTRWFLGYTCCDACGRLFVKGNYCPVCLKVYRDSEVIPMVCCDICEKWVHIECDGISEEKYQQFQADQNLQYTCAACRGDCYQIRDTDDAVRELWKRRDIFDHDLMVTLRAAAGLPPLEDISPSYPNSDDERIGSIALKNDSRNTLKFSFKSTSGEPPLNSSEKVKSASKNSGSSKKHSKKKAYQGKIPGDQEEIFLERRHDAKSSGSNLADQIIDDRSSSRNNGTEAALSSLIRSPEKDIKSSPMEKAAANNVDMVPKVKIKGSKIPSLRFKDISGENAAKNDTARGTKLVIHIGSRNKNSSGSPRSETSSCQREQEQGLMHGGKVDATSQLKSSKNETKEKCVMKLVKDTGSQQRSNSLLEDLATSRSHATGKRSSVIGAVTEGAGESATRSRAFGQKQLMGGNHQRENQGTPSSNSASNSPNDLKPLLKLKFKSPYFEQRSTWASQQEESNSVKGQRSKRKRPSMDKSDAIEDGSLVTRHQQSSADEAMDANWILRKLGKDAIGKRVEVHLSSDGSWNQGEVVDVMQGTLSVRLDDGRSETLELGKQSVRFIAQRTKSGRK